MSDLKKEAARAALSFLKPELTIGLGAGSTIGYLIALIDSEIQFKSTLRFTSPCLETERILISHGLNFTGSSRLKKLHYYFDSCDQVDENLSAFKSGGGIHAGEKVCARMAEEFILLVDYTKLVPVLNATFPLCIEILPKALTYVMSTMETIYANYGIRVNLRESDKKTGPIISDNGNFLADIYFTTMPDLQELNIDVKLLTGIIEHSLFYKMARRVIIAEPENIKILTLQ